MAVGACFGYFSNSLGGVRLGELGAMGRGLCSLAPVVVKLRVGPMGLICRLGGFGWLGGFDGCWHGFGAVGRGGRSLACVVVSSSSWFARLLLGGDRCVVRWRACG